MKKLRGILYLILLAVPLIFWQAPNAMAAADCFCESAHGANGVADCVEAPNEGACVQLKNDPAYSKYTAGCGWIKLPVTCQAAKTSWIAANDAQIKAGAGSVVSNGGGLLDFDPCIKADTLPQGSNCRDVTIFIQLLLRLSRYVFSIIGALAFIMFIYGGFTLILSQGNSEKVQQGKTIITSAVIGLVIAFGGYVLVKFLATALGVDASFISGL